MKRAVALGFFDGVHLGHGALLRRTAERAKELGAVSAACTFDVHPAAALTGRPTPLLSTVAERKALIGGLYGVEETIVLPFDRAMRELPWDRFVRETLVERLEACHLVVGEDYRFGRGGAGDTERLAGLCRELGLGLDVVEQVRLDGTVVSSSHIRRLMAQGDMKEAVRRLGHPQLLRGVVAHGKGLGGTLGFPTVNLTLPGELLLPAHGVYVSRIRLEDGESYPAATNIGVRPTVDDGEAVTVESFLLDFRGDLYGRTVWLELFHRLRPERAFESLEELRAEVAKNAQQVRTFFAEAGEEGRKI